jgi:hypothetical protein
LVTLTKTLIFDTYHFFDRSAVVRDL